MTRRPTVKRSPWPGPRRLHAAQDDSTLQILASSVGDSADGLVLIDSTTDGVGGPLHRLEQLSQSGEDPTIFFSRIEYADLDEALRSSPPWIRREWLRSRGKQLLPAIFASQHLNRRSASINALFPPDRIEASREPYPAGIASEGLQGNDRREKGRGRRRAGPGLRLQPARGSNRVDRCCQGGRGTRKSRNTTSSIKR